MSVAITRAQGQCALFVAALLALAACVVVLAPPARANGSRSCVAAAHRGDQAHGSENSMRAFRAAVHRRANYLEMDVQVTRDGRFAVMHDETINRTTRGTGRIITKTWGQLRRVKLNDGQRIPSLHAVLDMVRPTRSGVLIELKWVPASRFGRLKRLIDTFGTSRLVVNSFSPYVVKRFRERYPGVRTALAVNRPISVKQARTYGGVMPDWRHVTDSWLANLRAAGVATYLWTVDTARGWQRFSGRVTLVLTNRTAGYAAWRRSHCG